MSNKEFILVGLLVVSLLLFSGWQIVGITVFGINLKPSQEGGSTQLQNITQELKVIDIRPEKLFYKLNDNVTVFFTVSNTLNVSYGIMVNWIHVGKIYEGWKTQSTLLYNITDTSNAYQTWRNLSLTGTWTMQLLLNYSFLGVEKVIENTTSVDILEPV